MPSPPQYKTAGSAEGISLDNARSQDDGRRERDWNKPLVTRPVGLVEDPQHKKDYHQPTD